MKRISLRFEILIICAVTILAGSVAAQPADCPHPAVTGASATPTTLIGGVFNYDIVLTFASAIPQG